ncbi:MAG: cytochrome c biogenesis CcdA family protein [Leucobacter sp.]
MELQGIVSDGQVLVASLIAFAAGLVSFLSPCVLPLVPGYLAYVSATATDTSEALEARRVRRRMVLGALLFVAGFTVIFVILLSLAGSIGSWLLQWENLITRIMGVLIIAMGLVFMGLFGGMQRTARLRFKPRLGLAGAPALGAVFAIGWTPCIGPTLAVIGTLALQGGTAWRGAWLALIYCLGLGLPFVLAAFGFGWMTTATAFFKRHIRTVNLIGGGLLIVIGLLMVSGVWSQIMYALQAVMSSYVPAI